MDKNEIKRYLQNFSWGASDTSADTSPIAYDAIADINLCFKITPRPQLRTRATTIIKNGQVRSHVHKSEKAIIDEADFFQLAYNDPQRPKTPMTGPIMLTLHAYFDRPKSVKSVHHTVKPDLDNLIKFALDGLTRAGYFNDDKQVYFHGRSGKFYVTEHIPRPCWIINLREIPGRNIK
jgi:Holliday junction resolvase RusA-like endonuclease